MTKVTLTSSVRYTPSEVFVVRNFTYRGNRDAIDSELNNALSSVGFLKDF